ncbi:17616_t:CDS:1, partial [Dentiscutata erythropus]
MATRRVLGESNIQNLPEQGQTVAQRNKRSISTKETDRKVKKTKKHDEHESTNILAEIPDKHITEIIDRHINEITEKKSLSELYKSQFSLWYLELRSGFNILLYGYGPKKELLEDFSDAYLRDQPLIVVNGFYPKLDVRETLMQIIDGIDIDVDIKPGTRASMEKLTTLIREYFSNPDRDFQRLYIVIHNIDGQNLRTSQVLDCLGTFASCPNIHLVASVDNFNATLLFDQDRTAMFNWVWHDTSTFVSNEKDVKLTDDTSTVVSNEKEVKLTDDVSTVVSNEKEVKLTEDASTVVSNEKEVKLTEDAST